MENTPTSFGSALYQKSVLFSIIQIVIVKIAPVKSPQNQIMLHQLMSGMIDDLWQRNNSKRRPNLIVYAGNWDSFPESFRIFSISIENPGKKQELDG